MFPNAQDALPLPRRPNLERYKKLAKDLVKACKSDDVAGAQLMIARSHGFDTWARFSKHLNGQKYKASAIARYEKAP
jgi:hypothetical protein